VLDTVATVYLATGQLIKAAELCLEILKTAKEGSAAWFRARLLQAQIAERRDKAEQGHKILQDALNRCRGMPDEDLLSAATLMEKLEEKIRPPVAPRRNNEP
jgi:hypothetical protein